MATTLANKWEELRTLPKAYYRRCEPRDGWRRWELVIDEGDAWNDVIPDHPVTRYAVCVHQLAAEGVLHGEQAIASAWTGGADDGVEIEADGHYRTMDDALADPTSCLGMAPL
jgi:hypothetical protein